MGFQLQALRDSPRSLDKVSNQAVSIIEQRKGEHLHILWQ